MKRLYPALLAAALAAGIPRAQEGKVIHLDEDAHPAPGDTGWTASGGTATQADSLAAFRPDSLKDEVIRSAESAPSPFAAKAGPKDSADSVAALLRGRRPTLSFHFGIDFLDLDAKETFVAALDARMRRDSLTALQPYEEVHLALPFGLQFSLPAGPYFDLVAKTHSFWYRQTAVLGRGGATVDEESFAVQANLGGVGLRYHVPPTLLSVNGQLGLYVQGAYYWLLAGGEMYTGLGGAPAEFDPAGSGWEVMLGFNQAVTKSWSLTGNLGFLSLGFESERPWTALVSQAAPPGTVDWKLAAVQASFNLNWHFGVKPPDGTTGAPAASVVPTAPVGGPAAPAGTGSAPPK